MIHYGREIKTNQKVWGNIENRPRRMYRRQPLAIDKLAARPSSIDLVKKVERENGRLVRSTTTSEKRPIKTCGRVSRLLRSGHYRKAGHGNDRKVQKSSTPRNGDLWRYFAGGAMDIWEIYGEKDLPDP